MFYYYYYYLLSLLLILPASPPNNVSLWFLGAEGKDYGTLGKILFIR